MSATSGRASLDGGLWVQCVCTSLVAVGAAFASYRHGQAFAMRFGADAITAMIWPLIVDGLLMTVTVELWKPGRAGKWRAWLAFLVGVALSLCANVASAPSPSPLAITVAASPPLALLLAVELLNRALARRRIKMVADASSTDSHETTAHPGEPCTEGKAARQASSGVALSMGSIDPDPHAQTAEHRMWAYYQTQCALGRVPTGAELDTVADTNNYGRKVIRRWRVEGRLPTVDDDHS